MSRREDRREAIAAAQAAARRYNATWDRRRGTDRQYDAHTAAHNELVSALRRLSGWQRSKINATLKRDKR